MSSDLDILAGALVRRLTPIKYPPFPTLVQPFGHENRVASRREDSKKELRYPAVKSMRGTTLVQPFGHENRVASRREDSLPLCAKSAPLRYRYHLRFDVSALIITGVSTGEER